MGTSKDSNAGGAPTPRLIRAHRLHWTQTLSSNRSSPTPVPGWPRLRSTGECKERRRRFDPQTKSRPCPASSVLYIPLVSWAKSSIFGVVHKANPGQATLWRKALEQARSHLESEPPTRRRESAANHHPPRALPLVPAAARKSPSSPPTSPAPGKCMDLKGQGSEGTDWEDTNGNLTL